MKKEKLGFFKKMFLVLTDFRAYPFLVKHEKFRVSFLYFLTLIIFLSCAITISVFYHMKAVSTNILENYDEVIPDFSLIDGKLSVEEKKYEKIRADVFLIVDTDYSYSEFIHTENYQRGILYRNVVQVHNDSISVEIENHLVYQIMLSELGFDTDKVDLYPKLENYVRSPLEGLNLFVLLYMTVFLSSLISLLVKIVFAAAIISILCVVRGIYLDYKNYLKIAIYTYTLPAIVEVCAFCIVGPGKQYTEIASFLLEYIYVVYALRAIRLDAFIMMLGQKKSNRFHPDISETDISNENTNEESLSEEEPKTNNQEEDDEKEEK